MSPAPSLPRRPDESMSLLVDLSRQPLEPGYAEAAARRSGERTPGERRGSAITLAVGVLAATLLIVIAAVQTHAQSPASSRSRDALVAAVQRETTSVTELERQVQSLTANGAALRDELLSASNEGDRLTRQLAAEELVAGAIAVTGPGLRVTVDDAPASDGTGNRVQDRDLQVISNGLWAAGAEAVAVNGQRLTAQSSIRQAGDAILVDFKPLSPPYDVVAVGDPVALETSFAAGPAAARMRTLSQLYGLRFSYDRVRHLTLAAASADTLRYARPVPSATKGSP